MKESLWNNLVIILGVVAVAMVAAAMAAMVAMVAPVVAMVAMVVAMVAMVVAVAAAVAMENPKHACVTLSSIIVICGITLFFTLPIILNPPAMITVICQVTETVSPTIIIHNSTTQTITGQLNIVNSTTTEIASKISCP